MAQRLLGQDHLDTLAYEMNVANVYRAQGRYQEAEPLYEHNLESKRRVLGAEHPAPSTRWATSPITTRRPAATRRPKPSIARSWTVSRRIHGEKAPATISVMNNLANDLALMGRFEEAAPLMQRTLEIKVELYGADHPSTLNSVANLAELNDQLGRDVEAERLAPTGARRPHARPRPGSSADHRCHGTPGRHASRTPAASRKPSASRRRPRREAPRASASVTRPRWPPTTHTRAPSWGCSGPGKPKRSCRRQLTILEREEAAGRGRG